MNENLNFFLSFKLNLNKLSTRQLWIMWITYYKEDPYLSKPIIHSYPQNLWIKLKKWWTVMK